MSLDTIRPSSGGMRGPYVLKIRAIRISSSYWRSNVLAAASANRFASSWLARGPVVLTFPRSSSRGGCTPGSPYTSLVDAEQEPGVAQAGELEQPKCALAPDAEDLEAEPVDAPG